MTSQSPSASAPFGLLGRTLGHSWSPRIHSVLGSSPYALIEREPEVDRQISDDSVATNDVESVAVPQQQTDFDDEMTLDDITATPREKSREEIIAEAEAAAFAEAEASDS